MADHADSVPMRPISSPSRTGRDSATTTGRSTPPKPASLAKKSTGSWLCSEGDYEEYIVALSKSNPGLATPDPNNKDNPLQDGHARVVLLESSSEGDPTFKKNEFAQGTKLKEHFEEASRNLNHKFRRIYLMEGLAPTYVSIVGGHFFMNPAFFQRHERTCVWSNDFTPTSDALPQPSSLDPETTFHLQYCELREFNMPLVTEPCFCHHTKRHVGMTAPRSKTTTAIVRRKIGWWSQRTEAGGWDVVILCDPELDQLNPVPKEFVKDEGKVRAIENPTENLKNTPFQGGYVDFLPTPTFAKAIELSKCVDGTNVDKLHPRKSMLYDLIYYFEHHSSHLSKSEWENPVASSYFLKKIVAAHSMQLVDYIKTMLPSLELKLATAWEKEQKHWEALQLISRRCGNYRDDVEDTLFSLGYSLEVPTGRRTEDRKGRRVYECEKDFQYVYLRLKVLKERTDSLMQAMTGLASIAGNRQNLEEARRVQRLTGLALFFVPLAYTSSLFSMQDSYAPNKNKFWVYWVVAIGTVILTFGLAWILNRSIDAEAQWTLRPLDLLNPWGNKKGPGKMKRQRSIYDRNYQR